MPGNKLRQLDNGAVVVEAQGVPYRELNRQLRELASAGVRQIILEGIRGQRYLGSGLDFPDLLLQVKGIPGEDLGFNLSGPTIEVFGHAQNAVANTMDSGRIIVHGLGGDALAYGMRGGELYVRDDVGYRVGIHMKEYADKVPVVVIGGTAGDYLGEYMAGGIIILLNRNNRQEMVAGASPRTLATGIHGGALYIFAYDLPAELLGIGAKPVEAGGGAEREKVEHYVRQFCRHFSLDAAPLLERRLIKIVPVGSRPFASFYYPAYPVATGLKPQHVQRTSPCEAACPASVPTGRFLRLLRLGEPEQAVALMDEVTPLRYSCCGFICPHLCMQNCTRAKVDFAVRTAELARRFKDMPVTPPVRQHGEEIAVIGAGPAGLSAAYQLARSGYGVTVFDEAERPGGKLYQVISRQRLPLDDLEHDLARIEAMGVKFVTAALINARRLEQMLDEYAYIIIAVGAHQANIPPVAGREYLLSGLDFLKEHNRCLARGEALYGREGEKIVVVGGGDAAVDGMEALLEMGIAPQHITVIDVKKPSADIAARCRLEQLGVSFRYPLFLQEATAQGVYVNDALGQREFIPADTILVFINERPELDLLPPLLKEQADERGFYRHGGENTFRTLHPRISAVGDMQGLGLVTTNIGRGRQCAREVDALLRGRPYTPEVKDPQDAAYLFPGRAVPLAAGEAEIDEEQDRCLHCGICVQCDACVEACPRQALSRNGEEFSVDHTRCGGCGTCAATCLGGVIRMQEARSKKQEAGSKRQEAGGKRQEARGRRQE
jgi:NADPH-dependent glutamate synthase beta subunit-like oxidoreductase/glutamate synthase domain-containing protein 3/Pyruvate/2-oxoacid:ferredoxin oxidoreductase delta subunit